MNRAYSLLTVKAVSEDDRVIEGIATTPTPDRVGDIVEPLGVAFKNPLPLLHQHNHREPVGTVVFQAPTKDGIRFRASLPKITEPGPLKDRVDTAWGEVKAGLVRGVSIGFRALEYSIMDDGGYRFVKSEVIELSLVTVPANADATITSIKSIDTRQRAASGRMVAESTNPGVSGSSSTSQRKENRDMDIMQQLADLEADRATKAAEMQAIINKAAADGRDLGSLDAEEQDQYDALAASAKSIAVKIGRLEGMAAALGTAKPVSKAVTTQQDGSRQRAAGAIVVKDKELPQGLRFARLVKCLGMARGSRFEAREFAKQFYHDDYLLQKATVAAGTTSHATWAGPLVGETSQVYADFAEYLRPMTILGKFGNGGVPGLLRVPFRTRLLSQSTGTGAGWVGEGKGIAVTKGGFASTSLEPRKLATIAVLTRELVESSSPAADMLIRDELAAACRDQMDRSFIDPHSAAITDVRPASITSGLTALHSTGTDADAVRVDLRALIASFVAANNPLTSGVWIMSALTALTLSLMENSLGQRSFPDINVNGGTLLSLPVITSESVTATIDSGGQYIVLANAADVYYANEGGMMVDMSREASLEMSDAPANNSDTPTAAQLVSLYQTDSMAFRVMQEVNWARRRSTGVAMLEDVAYVVAA